MISKMRIVETKKVGGEKDFGDGREFMRFNFGYHRDGLVVNGLTVRVSGG